jgi:hypothetical protein
MASAMFAPHGTRHVLQSSVEPYRAAGVMTDWMHGEVGATSYTIELRPRGRGGIVLPPEDRPMCDEGLASLRALRAAAR